MEWLAKLTRNEYFCWFLKPPNPTTTPLHTDTPTQQQPSLAHNPQPPTPLKHHTHPVHVATFLLLKKRPKTQENMNGRNQHKCTKRGNTLLKKSTSIQKETGRSSDLFKMIPCLRKILNRLFASFAIALFSWKKLPKNVRVLTSSQILINVQKYLCF